MHVGHMFTEHEKKIAKEYLANQISISFTQDAWMAPNVTAFMALTAHFINKTFQIHNLNLVVLHVEGEFFF